MKFTPEEMAAIATYEKNIEIAVRSNYLRHVGRSGLAVLVPIYQRATGDRQPVHDNCAPCVLGFLKRLGALYFAAKAKEEAARRPAEDPAPARTPRRRRASNPEE